MKNTFKKIGAKTLLLVGLPLIFIFGCRQKKPPVIPLLNDVKLDSSLGIGNKFQSLSLAGSLIVFNPDSANKVLIIGINNKIINTIIYKAPDGASPLQSLIPFAVDSVSKQIFIYSPLESTIRTYDADGAFKNKILIPKANYDTFFKLNGKFVFTVTTVNKKDGSKGETKAYIIDSAGHYVEGS